MDKPKHFVDPYVEKLKMEGRKTKTKQEFIPSTQTMLTNSGDAMLTSDDSFDQSGKSTHILNVTNSSFTVAVSFSVQSREKGTAIERRACALDVHRHLPHPPSRRHPLLLHLLTRSPQRRLHAARRWDLAL